MFYSKFTDHIIDHVLEEIPDEAYMIMKKKLSSQDFASVIIDGYVVPYLKECLSMSEMFLEHSDSRDSDILLGVIKTLKMTPNKLCKEIKVVK